MTEEDFFGRIINPGVNSHYFELCEVCEKRPPNWLESRKNQDVSEVRLTCIECHDEYITKLNQIPDADNDSEFEVYDEIPDEVDDITPVERPAWMQEFIDDGIKDGAIEVIGGSEDAEENIESYNKMDESKVNDEDEPIIVETLEELTDRPATWLQGFIKEALFGLNPEEWLSQQNAFSSEDIDLTILTLKGMSTNQVTNVKISAIHCLNSIINRFPDKKDDIIQSISMFIDDLDEMVANYAQQTIDAAK